MQTESGYRTGGDAPDRLGPVAELGGGDPAAHATGWPLEDDPHRTQHPARHDVVLHLQCARPVCRTSGVRTRQILARGRFGIATKEQTRKLERAWAKHRKEYGLDLYGQTEGAGDTGVPEPHADHRPVLNVVTFETELKGVYPGPGTG